MSDDSSKRSLNPKAKWGWVAALLVSIISIIFAQFLVAIMISSLGWDIESLSLTQTYTVGLAAVALPLGGIYLYLRKLKAGPSALGLAKLPEPFLKPVLKAFGLYVLSTMGAMLLLTAIAPSVDLDQAQNLGLGDNPAVWYEFVLLALLLSAVTPVSEETIFRGFMLKGLAKRFGWAPAAVVTSLIFGLAHGQLNVAIDTAIMGWFSAQLVIGTGSLWPSIALHALKNSIAFIFVYLGPLVS